MNENLFEHVSSIIEARYGSYLIDCLTNKEKPLSYKKFWDKTAMEIAREVSEKAAADIPKNKWKNAVYAAGRTKESEYFCNQCEHPVLIDKSMEDKAKIATIICEECLPELTNKTNKELLNQILHKYI